MGLYKSFAWGVIRVLRCFVWVLQVCIRDYMGGIGFCKRSIWSLLCFTRELRGVIVVILVSSPIWCLEYAVAQDLALTVISAPISALPPRI